MPQRTCHISKAFGETLTLSTLLSMFNVELLLRVQSELRCIIRSSARHCEKHLSAQITPGGEGGFWISAVPPINGWLREGGGGGVFRVRHCQ